LFLGKEMVPQQRSVVAGAAFATKLQPPGGDSAVQPLVIERLQGVFIYGQSKV
jgi:hypothetical protein